MTPAAESDFDPELTAAHVDLFAVFRCQCGRLAGMADQSANGKAAMVHESPRCARFEGVETLAGAVAYFRSLQQIDLTVDVARQLARNCQP